MEHSILQQNHARRLDMPIWLLICFSMFNSWQMGFIYFMGPSLVLNGRTPLPIDMDNVTLLIAAGYVLAIIWMIILPYFAVWAARVSAATALASIVGLFLPLSAEVLALLLYIQTFCCCFMIGFETFTISNLFTERSGITHLTAAYSVALFIIAVVQNDLLPVSFRMFRVLALTMVVLLAVFFFRVPAARDVCPHYVKKGDGLRCPAKLFGGIVLYSFVVDIMMLGGPAAVAAVKNGVFLAYLADAVGSLILWQLYKRRGIHPFQVVSVFMGLSVVGYLFLHISAYLPALCYPACVLIGFGFIPCQMMPLYGLIMMKSYPSRLIAPGIMGMALFTVLVHSALVEAFRSLPEMLPLAYLAITVISIVIYWHLSPFLVHILQNKPSAPAEQPRSQEASGETLPRPKGMPAHPLLQQLTSREWEVLSLIGNGYSNKEIAGILYISEHTVNDYTKKIYRKLNVHSRHAAAQVINRCDLFAK